MTRLDRIATLKVGGRIPPAELTDLVSGILSEVGMSVFESGTAAKILVNTQLHGIDSHGIAHLPTYVRRLIDRAIEPAPNIKITRSEAASVIDGDNGLGVIVAQHAVDEACELALNYGVGACAVRNSNHFGAALPLVSEAAKNGYVVLCFSNAAPTMAPWDGKDAILGTNPLAAAFPSGSGSPIVIDMATSAVARGRIRKAERAGEAIPADWALDEHGQPTTNAAAALKGTVQPLAGAKGYALTLAVELLSTALSGGRAGFDVLNPHDKTVAPASVSHLFVAFYPPKFSGQIAANTASDRLKSKIETSAPREKLRPRVPGSRASAAASERRENGIPITADLIASLRESALLVSRQAAQKS